MSDPARSPSTAPDGPKEEPVDITDSFTPEELAVMDKRSPVDAAAAVAWLMGEGPDPWHGESN